MHFVRNDGFAFPPVLDEVLRRHFWKGGAPSVADLRPLARALGELWPALAQKRGQLAGPGHYSGASKLTDAYAAYYLPANVMKLPLILDEMRLGGIGLSGGADQPLRWLDLGCGPGTAYWGLAWWAKHRGVAFEYWGLEQSQSFLDVAQVLGRELARELAIGVGGAGRASHWESYHHMSPPEAPHMSPPEAPRGAGESDRLPKDLARKLRAVNPRVVSFMNSIGEMAPDPARRNSFVDKVVDELKALAREDGQPRWLIVVEPGSQAASRELLAVRETLRARQAAKGDVRIWLPCLSARPCGAFEKEGDWCHEEVACGFPKWMDALGAEAGLRKEALLFSYLVVSVGVHPPATPALPEGGLRVVSQRMKEKGLTQCFLCTPGGKRKARVLDSRQTPENEAFAGVVRGQLFDSVEFDEKGSVLSLEESPLAVEIDPAVFPPL